MVQSRFKSSAMKVTAADSEKMNLSVRIDPKRTSIDGEIAKRKKLGAEELRLSRVDVRERQKRFEKMANGANLQDGRKSGIMERSRSEENHRINTVNPELRGKWPRAKSESVDRVVDIHPKMKKMNIVATSSKRNAPNESVKSAAPTKRPENNTPKAWVQPLKQESVEAKNESRKPAPLPVKDKVHAINNVYNVESVPIEREPRKTKSDARNIVSNSARHGEKPVSKSQSLNRAKSQSMTITVASRPSTKETVNQSTTKKPIVRVNSKASEKSNVSAKITINSHHERPEHENSSRNDKRQVRQPQESEEPKRAEVKDRKESTSSYYRDVRENLRDRRTSTNSKSEFLEDILSGENHGMAKALGLSEELIDLIKEEEQFWNRQVELKRWRETQEKKYRDISRVYDTEKEKRIAELREEHEKRKSPKTARAKRDENEIEKMRLAEENYLAEEAERLAMLVKKQKESKREIYGDGSSRGEGNNPPSSETKRKIYLKQHSFDEKTFSYDEDSKSNHKRYSYPPPNHTTGEPAKARYSDVTPSNFARKSDPAKEISIINRQPPARQKTTSAEHANGSNEERPSFEKERNSRGKYLNRQRSHESESGSRSSDRGSRRSSHESRHLSPNSRPQEKDYWSFDHDSRQRKHRTSDPDHRSRHSYSEANSSGKDSYNSRRQHSDRDQKTNSNGESIRTNRETFPENQSGLDHLQSERVFSEQCDGKMRTYHVTSVAVRYSRASSSSSSNLKRDRSVNNNEIAIRKPDQVDSTFDQPIRNAKHDPPIREKPVNHVTPIGWFSDDDDVFDRRTNIDIPSPRGCFSDDEMAGEYFREKLYDVRRVWIEIHQRIRCVGCSSLIRESQAMSVIGKDIYWHNLCFNCVVCGVRLVAAKGTGKVKVRVIYERLHCGSCYSTNGDKLSEV